eukprot:UN34084
MGAVCSATSLSDDNNQILSAKHIFSPGNKEVHSDGYFNNPKLGNATTDTGDNSPTPTPAKNRILVRHPSKLNYNALNGRRGLSNEAKLLQRPPTRVDMRPGWYRVIGNASITTTKERKRFDKNSEVLGKIT